MNISPPKGTEKMTEDNSNELFRLLEIDIVFYSHNQLINFLEALEKWHTHGCRVLLLKMGANFTWPSFAVKLWW